MTFIDGDENPVPDCAVSFCTDDACTTVIADENGVATFTGAPYAYHIQVIAVPEGYAFDTSMEIYTRETGDDLLLTVSKEVG